MFSSATTALRMRRLAAFALCLFIMPLTTACTEDEVETTPETPVEYDKCIMHEPEGAVCADNTQYRYFTKHRKDSQNVLVLFEGGGACWNWETCTAAAGSLGALGVDCVMDKHNNPDSEKHCISENYADTYYPLPSTISPELLASFQAMIPKWASVSIEGVSIDTVLPLANSGGQGTEKISPMHDWNLVFVPYCTSDLYAGNKVAGYVNPEDPEDVVTFRHVGLTNSRIVAEELNEMFPTIPEFAMNGCSAGGAGVMATYHFFRSAMTGIEKGFVFSDAGPFFPTADSSPNDTHSNPLHAAVREAWGISSVFDLLITDHPDIIAEEPEHVSDLYRILSETYPQDRFSVAHTQTDYNYSLYSYTSFNDMHHRARNSEDAKKIYQYWADDNNNLINELSSLENVSVYMPYWRKTNDSHCISLIGIEDAADSGDELDGLIQIIGDPINKYYAGTEIHEGEQTYTYRDHAIEVLTAPTNADVHSRVGQGAPARMGLRQFCTPDSLDDTKCQCAFDEFDKVDEDADRGRDLCACFAGNLSASLDQCECIIDVDLEDEEAAIAARQACLSN